MKLLWLDGDGCFHESEKRFFIAATYHGAATVYDAWQLTTPHAIRVRGTPFMTAELAMLACEDMASRDDMQQFGTPGEDHG